jgi:hypothetical protein
MLGPSSKNISSNNELGILIHQTKAIFAPKFKGGFA